MKLVVIGGGFYFLQISKIISFFMQAFNGFISNVQKLLMFLRIGLLNFLEASRKAFNGR